MSLEQNVAALMAQMPRSGKRDLRDGHPHPSSPLRTDVLVPQTPLPHDGVNVATVTPTATAAAVGLVRVQSPIVAKRISYFPTGGGADPTVMRLALYREDGQLKLFDVTDGVDDAVSALRSITFDGVFLSPGNYYIFCCLSSGGAGPNIPPIIVYNTGTAFAAIALSTALDIQGDLTVTGGVAPDTFDPTGLSVGADRTIAFRLDGQ